MDIHKTLKEISEHNNIAFKLQKVNKQKALEHLFKAQEKAMKLDIYLSKHILL